MTKPTYPDLTKPDLYAEGWYAAHADRLLGVKLVTAWTAPGAYGRGYRDGWHSIGEETMNECMDYPDDARETHLYSVNVQPDEDPGYYWLVDDSGRDRLYDHYPTRADVEDFAAIARFDG